MRTGPDTLCKDLRPFGVDRSTAGGTAGARGEPIASADRDLHSAIGQFTSAKFRCRSSNQDLLDDALASGRGSFGG